MSRQKILFSLLTLLCLCALLITGCGEDKKGQRVPSDKLPEGVLEYTVLPFNDQIYFVAMFVTEALQQRMVADRYNDLVCRFDMENGDPKKLEELVRKTRDAYERAEQTAEMAMYVSIALCELEKTPGYTPFKLPQEEKKSALNITSPLLSTAYAKEPYLVKTVHGPTAGSPQVIEVFSNGRARFSNEGTPPEKGWIYDQKMAEKWEAEQAKADFKYRSSYVATAAGKCAKTYISAQSGGLVGGVDTTVKGFNAAA